MEGLQLFQTLILYCQNFKSHKFVNQYNIGSLVQNKILEVMHYGYLALPLYSSYGKVELTHYRT